MTQKRRLTFQSVDEKRITGVMEEEGRYYVFVVSRDDHVSLGGIPTGRPMDHDRFRKIHARHFPEVLFPEREVEVEELKYRRLVEIYEANPDLWVNEPVEEPLTKVVAWRKVR